MFGNVNNKCLETIFEPKIGLAEPMTLCTNSAIIPQFNDRKHFEDKIYIEIINPPFAWNGFGYSQTIF